MCAKIVTGSTSLSPFPQKRGLSANYIVIGSQHFWTLTHCPPKRGGSVRQFGKVRSVLRIPRSAARRRLTTVAVAPSPARLEGRILSALRRSFALHSVPRPLPPVPCAAAPHERAPHADSVTV